MGKPIKFFKKFMLRKRVVKRPGFVPVNVAPPLRKFTLEASTSSTEDSHRGSRRRRRWRRRARFPDRKLVKIYVRSTFNNTFFALGSGQGDILAWCSSGSCGYRGKKKKTPYAAQKALGRLLRQLKVCRYIGVAIVINGVGRGRRGVARSVRRYGFRILGIVDKTGVAHNGCRLRKKRRRRFMLTK
jgi:small subunit ribosomal protein S11